MSNEKKTFDIQQKINILLNMKHKFTVNIVEVHHLPVEIEADTPEEARELVSDMLSNEDENINFDGLVYSHTNPPNEWPVEKK